MAVKVDIKIAFPIRREIASIALIPLLPWLKHFQATVRQRFLRYRELENLIGLFYVLLLFRFLLLLTSRLFYLFKFHVLRAKFTRKALRFAPLLVLHLLLNSIANHHRRRSIKEQ